MAIFDSFYLGTTNNRINFNDETNNPYYRVIRRFPTKRELKEFDIDLPEGPGIADFQSYIGKEYMILEGKMYPNDESSFHIGREALRKVASTVDEQEDTSSDQGYVPLVWSENITKQMNVKVLYVDMQESTGNGIIQPFRLVCKVKYPVILALQPSSGSIVIGSTTAGLGGATIPATIPLQIGAANSSATSLPFTLPVILGSTNAGTGSLSLVNSGDAAAYPTITINGPISKPRITNVTTGEFLELNVSLNSTSDSANFTYDQDSLSITALNTNNYGNLTSGSTLFKVKSGTNVFTLSGTSVGAGATATVSFQSTYSLS